MKREKGGEGVKTIYSLSLLDKFLMMGYLNPKKNLYVIYTMLLRKFNVGTKGDTLGESYTSWCIICYEYASKWDTLKIYPSKIIH